MAIVQLDFFEEPEISKLKAQNAEMKLSLDKVRKKLFAENGALKKQVNELSERLEIIEKNICKG